MIDLVHAVLTAPKHKRCQIFDRLAVAEAILKKLAKRKKLVLTQGRPSGK